MPRPQPLPQFDAATAERVRRIVGEQFDVELLRKQHEVQAITQRLRHGEALLGVLASGIRAQHGAASSTRPAALRRERAARAASGGGDAQPVVRVSALAHTLNSEQMRSVDAALAFIQARRDDSDESDGESDGSAESAESHARPPTPLLASRFHVIRRAVVGNTAERVTDGAYTHRWTVYVRGRAGDASPAQYVRRVRVFLHPSYRPDDIVDLHPPLFELTRRGWGEFPVRLQVFFADRRNKPVDLVHMLRLDGRPVETPIDFELDRRGCDVAAGDSETAAGPAALLAAAHAHAVFCSVCGTLVVRPRTAVALSALYCSARCEAAAAEIQAAVSVAGNGQPAPDADGDHPMADNDNDSDGDSDRPMAESVAGHSPDIVAVAASLRAFHQQAQAERAAETDSGSDSDSDSDANSHSDAHSDSDRAIDWVWSVVRPLELSCAPASRFSAAAALPQSDAPPADQAESRPLVRLPNCSDAAFADALDQRLVVGRLLLDAARLFLRDMVAAADRSMRANRVATVAAGQAPAPPSSQMAPQLLMLTPLHVLAAASRDPHAFDFCGGLDNPSRLRMPAAAASDPSAPPVPSAAALHVRLAVLACVLAVYALFALSTTAAVIRRHLRSPDPLLAKSSVPLLVVQAAAGLLVAILCLAAAMLPRYPCAVKLWAVYIGVLPWLATLAARALQRYAMLLSENTPLRPANSLVTIDMLVTPQAAEAEAEAAAEAGIIAARFVRFGALPDRPCTSATTTHSWSDFEVGLGHASVASLRGPPAPFCTPPTPTTRRPALVRLATTKTLLALLVLFTAACAVVAVVANATVHGLNVAQHVCYDSGWPMWPAYGLAILCTAVVFPALAFKLWPLTDPYALKPALLACMLVAQLAAVMFVVCETALSSIRGYFSELLVLWLAVTADHLVCVCWPLCRSAAMHTRFVDARLSQTGLTNTFKGSELRRSIYSSLYKDFYALIHRRDQWDAFLAFATTYYRSTIPAFLADYQTLKYKTIEALQQSLCPSCHPTQDPCRRVAAAAAVAVSGAKRPTGGRLPFHLELTRSPVNTQLSHDTHPLSQVVPVSKGIFESAVLLLPPKSVDEHTLFPEDVKSSFAAFVSTYFTKCSYMSITIPDDVIYDVHASLESSNVVLSTLDRAKDEVLFLLCTDIYAGYCKRHESQSAASTTP
ncbi:YEATS domain-containing protein 2 [Coemansia erecta]|uniref:YEATS domain-containing protein 2 n=1 Tax=Coemansia erecta TaxID=147472 RepID=A0A9W8CTR0_9FUNG|nr:YEATS domain-containing protein 2 [Coemansia erecta]